MTFKEFLSAANRTAKLTSEQIGEFLRAKALRLAPVVAATFTAGHELGAFVHRLNDRCARLFVLLGGTPR